MKLNEVIDAIAAGRRYRETGEQAIWRKGMEDLALIPPVYFKRDTWELEPVCIEIEISSGKAIYRRDIQMWAVPDEHLLNADIAALYAASKGEPEYVEPDPSVLMRMFMDAPGATTGGHKAIYRAGWDAAVKQMGGAK